MSRILALVAGVVVIVAAILAWSALYTVHQTEQAIVFQFGAPIEEVREPGLHVKMPFIQNVVYYDNRVLDFAPPAEEVITSDQKRFVVDAFARFRITEPLRFYQAVQTEAAARGQLRSYLSSSLRSVIGNRTLSAVLSEERTEIMRQIQADTNKAAQALGVEIIDVRIRRADLPQANAEAIFQRMKSEREREAREFRAQGAELAQRIRSRADRERTVLIAEAERTAQTLRGQGDGDAIKIYADAFGRDPSFFTFYRSMQAYREALGADGTTFVLSPESDFFRYFGDPAGGGQTARAPTLPGIASPQNRTSPAEAPATPR